MENPQSLRAACANPDALFALSEDQLLHLVYREFPDEIDRLRRAYSIRDSQWSPPSTPSPSYVLYQNNHDEVNRSLVGFLALRWIHEGEYETFIQSQPLDLQLTRKSFDWVRRYYFQIVQDSDTLYALITSIVINDLGKDPQLALDYQNLTGKDISTLNHDAILLKACEPGLVPSLDRLSIQDRDDMLLAIELGAYLNFGQLGQAENAPVALSNLQRMKGRFRSFQLRFMEQLLDIAGAAGHMDWTCAKKLNQPIFESYQNVYYACEGVMAGTLDARGGYDFVLKKRAEFIHAKGFRLLKIEEDPYQRALMRLLCMGNVITLETAEMYETALNSLEDKAKEALIHALNVDGSIGSPAIQPTYTPAILGFIKEKRSLISAFQYLSRVMSASPKSPVDPSAVLIERSVLGVLKQHVESSEFRDDPTILERIDVPNDVIDLV
ncbi:hypothetical protein N7462_007515 [Penicillium macrosclerotiorum]|uniref:uncharacterized protein n=1 Tax=Penicillium macrosclerotiorum TaxID=303699 RepID=UPI0025479D6C|nr:uncharacterized protein N7462_007515 [Penicillium macrosclerotiorum]KAJ5679271.1 hypothetical protein N7462_007515 [Penicillium macrosclerotiorum]